MKNSKVDLTSQLAAAFVEYTEEVALKAKEVCKEVAKEALAEIKKNSPKQHGKYKRGWRSKVSFENSEDIRITIYNKTDYQLIHLLEYGHVNRDGTRTQVKEHVRPAEWKATRELLKRLGKAVRE